MENRIELHGGEIFLTQNKDDAYKVVSGNILVYIVPYQKKTAGRRSFLYEAKSGETLPSFVYRDSEYREWRFLFCAVDKAQLQVLSGACTNVLRKKFAGKAKIQNFALEGFDNGLVDQYEMNLVAEDAFIHKTQHEKETTKRNTLELIWQVFHKGETKQKIDKSLNPLYEAAALVCKQEKIEIAPLERILECCGKDFSVADIAGISHFTYREIVLEGEWQKKDIGTIIVFDEKKTPFVCIRKRGGYVAYNPVTGQSQKVDKKLAERYEVKGFMFYRPLPAKSMGIMDLLKFSLSALKVSDLILLVAISVIITLVNSLIPTLNQQIYNDFIPLGEGVLLMQISCVLISFLISNVLFSVVKGLTNFRISSRVAYSVQNAAYDRLFNLPESFFRNYESADLSQRVMGMEGFIKNIINIAVSSFVILINFWVFFGRMVSYSSKLSGIAVISLVIYALVSWTISQFCVAYAGKMAELEGHASSKLYQFINGIAKIRITGSEDRALYEYMKPFTESRKLQTKYDRIKLVNETLDIAVTTIFSMIFYVVIIKGNMDIPLGTFLAFESAFGAFSGVFLNAFDRLTNINELRPTYNRLKPILEAVPEFDTTKELPGELTGGIEISNVTFRYQEDAPNVLNDISLSIAPGEYVGLVGPSGCGKSTLLKLLLGFEKPNAGKIYYDDKDIESVDKRALRKKFGVVLQDGNLISGSIFENITITAPKATVKDVQKVVADVGLKDDIAAMPMGLHTVLSEDCGTISGGQQQRILIARAIIGNPKILFFDEATSALDNVTQSMVCETLEKMNSTRIVIAHRLSTIIKCDRIIVFDSGRIVEQGTYEQLMENKGLFYSLASRQIS